LAPCQAAQCVPDTSHEIRRKESVPDPAGRDLLPNSQATQRISGRF